jgi:methionyl-tRNA formyltransferase
LPLKVVFFGTPDAAVTVLSALIGSHHEVIAVVTAPDRPKGRGMEVGPPPVKLCAEKAGIQVFQPSTLKTPEAQQRLSLYVEAGAEVFVVAAYGFILPKEVLELPRLGCVNVHFSMLPSYRGAAPVQRAIMQGRTSTGVTIMRMDEGMDTGPALDALEEPIFPEDTAGELEARLAVKGGDLLIEVLDRIEKNDIEPVPQDDSLATAAPKVTPDQARVDWKRPASEIDGLVRATNPRPGAWTTFRGRRLKVWKAAASSTESESGAPGTFVQDQAVLVNTGSAPLVLKEVQPEGKRKMTGDEFVRGYRPGAGEMLE